MSEHEQAALTEQPQPTDLTIAICTIGRDGFVQAAIRSLLETTPPGVHLHIVLNGPDDPHLAGRLEKIIEAWAGPATLSALDERLSISGSHNTALDLATTSFITFMGDDDLVLEPRVEHLLEVFWTTVPTPAVVGSFCRRVSGSYDRPRFSTNKDYGPSSIEAWERERDSGELIEIVFPSAIYRTDLLRLVGGFEDRFGSAMDLATFTILGQHHPVIADPRRSFAHRIHDGSVTSSSAGQHAARLRYTEACIAAIRNGDEQPLWDEFVASEADTSAASRATGARHTMSATLFRQGGAAAASGQRLQGLAKLGASAVLSPRTFFGRLRSQVTRETNSEPVVSLLLNATVPEQLPFFESLRAELRSRSVELRVILADSGGNEQHAPPPLPWIERRPSHQTNVLGRSLPWQPGLDIATTSELIITEIGSRQLLNPVFGRSQRTLRTRHCFWDASDDYPWSTDQPPEETNLRRLIGKAHWFFASSAPMTNAAILAGIPADRITTLAPATDADLTTTTTRFADGVVDALDSPSR